MGKKISLIDIAKSRYGSDKNLPDWVDKRRAICLGCQFNSKNKPKEDWTTEESLWVTMNHGKDTCLKCKCMLSAKTKLAHAKCPLPEPKWGEVVEKSKTSFLEVENISTTPLDIKVEGNETILDYGKIKIGQETDVQLLIRDEKDNMTDISVQTSCGCTVPKLEKKGKVINLQIKYDTKRQGEFNKTVVLSYKQNNMNFQKVFKIKGKTE